MTLLLPLLSLLSSARAELPLPLQPECGEPDRPDLCPADLGERWNLISYVPDDWTDTVRAEELALGTGLWADRAWRLTTGSPEVIIAVIDSGIEWDRTSVLRKHYLNAGELPLPQDADGVEAASYDQNGDGYHNIDDWALDPRVSWDAGDDEADGLLDPSDLIYSFSNDTDDDGNGYIDDVSGWDFLWNDNDPYDDTRYGHGTGEAEDSTAEGNDGDGEIGTCPSCVVLSIRVSDSFVADGQSYGAALLFALDSNASVVQEALGNLSNGDFVRAVTDHAWERGVLIVGSAADEMSWHPNEPGANAHTLYTHANAYDEEDREEARSFLAYSNCTNHGGRLSVSAPSRSCSSGAVGVTAGVVGLLQSAALERGLVLTANEQYQLMTQTVDDIDLSGDPEFLEEDPIWYPSQAGWDRYFGYGRVNAWRAVAAVMDEQIPPEADILTPEWFQTTVDGGPIEVRGLARASRDSVARWTLEVGLGDQPEEGAYTEIASGTEAVDGLLGTLDPATLADLGFDDEGAPEPWALDEDQVDREDAVNAWTITLRLRVEDSAGRVGEMRRTHYVHRDPDLLPGFPIRVGGSLESSVKLVDLDGDGAREMVFGDGDGRLHALRADGTELDGWPVTSDPIEEADPANAGNHLASTGWMALASEDPRAAFLGAPAVGDLDGDGALEIVAGDLRGRIYCWSAAGALREGFPVSQGEVEETTPELIKDEGFMSTPALGDLDGDGDLEIVVGGMDGRVYAWTADGADLPGWPVALAYTAEDSLGARIVSSPALGDLDGDGADEVVIGASEVLGGGQYGPLYALDGDGSTLPGWPIRLFGLAADVLPYVGEGMPNAAALADLDHDGDLEIVAHLHTGPVSVLNADGTQAAQLSASLSQYGPGSNVYDVSAFPFINSPSLGDMDGDGVPDIFTGSIGSGYIEASNTDGQRVRVDYPFLAWSGADGSMFTDWPRNIEDMAFFVNPALADLDGDGDVEAIEGSGGFLLHAFTLEGDEVPGWPKVPGQWMASSPAVGDIDGDGTLDVVIGTRGGWLWAWRTSSPAGATAPWPMGGHDLANTHNHDKANPGYNTGYDVEHDVIEAKDEDRCGCASAPSSPLGILLLPLALLRRRGRGARAQGRMLTPTEPTTMGPSM